jgi:uncharacterized RDD family membrane protein YckC
VSSSTGDYATLVPVTGEAVALDLRVAEFPSRTLALTLDLAIQAAALLAIGWFASNVGSELDGAAATALGLVAVVGVIVGLPTLWETLSRGRSPGKAAAGLRVVRDDGGPVRFRHSFVRALLMIVDFWVTSGAVGLISALVSTRSKRLGDHLAGTVVVRHRVPRATTVHQLSYSMPPQLEAWATSLDLARLPDVTVLQARQLLVRADGLAPAVRVSLARQLAAEVAAYVSPAPPAGLSEEGYLRAVLTERMRRALAAQPRPTPPVVPSAMSAPAARESTPLPGANAVSASAPPAQSDGFAEPR